MRLKKGLVQIYTGNGKGKTTAALGLAMRASGAGLKVYICQFIKGKFYSEINAVKKTKNIRIEQYGRGCFIKKRPKKIDAQYAQIGLEKARKNCFSGDYDIVILDELNIALKLGLVKIEDVLDILTRKPSFVEIVLTGRYCPPRLMRHADLVTEMKELKHPYRLGIKARRGIEY